MEQKEHTKRKAGVILICGVTLAIIWKLIFPQFYYQLWKNFTFSLCIINESRKFTYRRKYCSPLS